MKRIFYNFISYFLFIIFLSVSFTSCDQEPVFWDIAHEYPPLKTLIKGAPSLITQAVIGETNALYVSNGVLWEFNTNVSEGNPEWKKMSPSPGGKIKTLAGTDGFLFTLDWNGEIKKWNGSEWITISVEEGKPEHIFCSGDYLFVGSLTGRAGTSDGYSILSMPKTGSSMTVIMRETGILRGAAPIGASHYLGTMGCGIYQSDGSSVSHVWGDEAYVLGLIKHNMSIVAVTDGGMIVYSTGGNSFEELITTSLWFSGAIASWQNADGEMLLLLGLLRSSGAFGYGYREFIWDGAGQDIQGPFTPGTQDLSSVITGSQYTSAIGNHAVTSLYVLQPDAFTADSDGRPIIYASTVKGGFWSYREREGRPQWNGENNIQ